jgi:hypothetical protein
MFVRSLNLPDVAIRQVAVIDGTPSLFGDLPLSLVQRSGDLVKFKEYWFDKAYTIINFENKNLHEEVFGAVCFVQRKGGDIENFSFTLDDAKIAKLYPCENPKKPWAKYPKMMLRYRARSIALKSQFADTINGVGIMEYDFNELGEEMKDVSPTNAASELKRAL